jgi:ABC-2 type transport system ATP-binding protein
MTHAIETAGLTKSFGGVRALNGIDLRIRQGSVYGLLGPNGAGKTTAILVARLLGLAAASRSLMHGTPAAREVALVLVWSAATVLVAAPVAMRLYRKER